MKLQEQATVPTTKTGIITQLSDWGLDNKYITHAKSRDYAALKLMIGGGKEAAVAAFDTAMGGTQPNVKDSSTNDKNPLAPLSEEFSSVLDADGALTEETKAKIKTLFEAAVHASVRAEVVRIEEEAKGEIAARVDEETVAMQEQVDKYVNYAVADWAEKNAVPLQTGVKLELQESFLLGMKKLFEDHYVTIPTDKEDAFVKLTEDVEQIKIRLNTQIDENVKLTTANRDLKKGLVFASLTEGMSAVQIDKFKTLSEATSFTAEDEYKTKLSLIRESFIKIETSAALASTTTDATPVLTEEVADTTVKSSRISGYEDVFKAKRK